MGYSMQGTTYVSALWSSEASSPRRFQMYWYNVKFNQGQWNCQGWCPHNGGFAYRGFTVYLSKLSILQPCSYLTHPQKAHSCHKPL